MAYISDGLSLFRSGLSGQDINEWILDSEDGPTAVRVNGYITDGQTKGLQVGDTVLLRHWTTFVDQYTKTGPVLDVQLMIVASRSTSDDSVDLTDGTAISVTDTD